MDAGQPITGSKDDIVIAAQIETAAEVQARLDAESQARMQAQMQASAQ
jgi:hypothetical protein